MSEHSEQVCFFDWVRLNREYAPNLEVRKTMQLCYSVPNGANLPKKKYKNKKGECKIWSSEAKWLIAEGMTKGIPDINLDWPAVLYQDENHNWHNYEIDLEKLIDEKEFHGLRLEMKFGKNKLTKEQKEKKALLEESGFRVAVCYSAAEAVKAVFEYLPFKESDYQGVKEFL
jgi:hypothetical protein